MVSCCEAGAPAADDRSQRPSNEQKRRMCKAHVVRMQARHAAARLHIYEWSFSCSRRGVHRSRDLNDCKHHMQLPYTLHIASSAADGECTGLLTQTSVCTHLVPCTSCPAPALDPYVYICITLSVLAPTLEPHILHEYADWLLLPLLGYSRTILIWHTSIPEKAIK